nr:MAG TPA: hypothetical protein [Caudoviricetes sp.]
MFYNVMYRYFRLCGELKREGRGYDGKRNDK